MQFLNPCALKGRCVQGSIHIGGVRVLHKAQHRQLYITCARLVILGPWWGLTGLRRWRVGGGEWVALIFFFSPEKNEMRVIGLKRVWFKLRRFWSVFYTRSQFADRNRPPGSLDVRKGVEKNGQHASRPERILENDFQ